MELITLNENTEILMKSRTILVTGANRGIGLAIVEELSKKSSDKIF